MRGRPRAPVSHVPSRLACGLWLLALGAGRSLGRARLTGGLFYARVPRRPSARLLLNLAAKSPPPRRAAHGMHADNIRRGSGQVPLKWPGIDGPSRPRRCPRPAPWPGAGLDANDGPSGRRSFSCSTSATPPAPRAWIRAARRRSQMAAAGSAVVPVEDPTRLLTGIQRSMEALQSDGCCRCIGDIAWAEGISSRSHG